MVLDSVAVIVALGVVAPGPVPALVSGNDAVAVIKRVNAVSTTFTISFQVPSAATITGSANGQGHGHVHTASPPGDLAGSSSKPTST